MWTWSDYVLRRRNELKPLCELRETDTLFVNQFIQVTLSSWNKDIHM